MDWRTTLACDGYSGEMTVEAISKDCNRLLGKRIRDNGIACFIFSGSENRLCAGYLENDTFRLCGEAETEEEALTLLWCDLRWKRTLKNAGYKGALDLVSLIGACPAALRQDDRGSVIGIVLKRCEPHTPHWMAGYPDFLWGAPSIFAEGAVANLWCSLASYRRAAV